MQGEYPGCLSSLSYLEITGRRGYIPSIVESIKNTVIQRAYWIRFFLLAIFIGAVAGFFLLYPINEFVFFYEHHPDSPTVWRFIYGQLTHSLKGFTPDKTSFYAGVGALLGLVVALFFKSWQKKLKHIEKLYSELGENLGALISQGEGPKLEFKSSFRWDMTQNKVNRALEAVVLKTLAGFMNSTGGTLLVGVDDNGGITGIEQDYKTLKKQNRDGFEQAVMTATAMKLGAENCQYIHILFHRIEERDVCRIIVSPSLRPVFVKHNGSAKFYLRTGGSTRELNVEEAMAYVSGLKRE